MGLDTTHDAWHGAYSSFMRWREAVAKAAGLPPLRDYYEGRVTYPGTTSASLMVLLDHSDCDGDISPADCAGIAVALEGLLPKLDAMGDGGGRVGRYGDATRRFIAGCRLAAERRERLEFH